MNNQLNLGRLESLYANGFNISTLFLIINGAGYITVLRQAQIFVKQTTQSTLLAYCSVSFMIGMLLALFSLLALVKINDSNYEHFILNKSHEDSHRIGRVKNTSKEEGRLDMHRKKVIQMMARWRLNYRLSLVGGMLGFLCGSTLIFGLYL